MATPGSPSLHYDGQLVFGLARLNLGVAVVFGTLAVAAFTLRVVARRRSKAQLHSDDWVICAAMIISVALCIMSVWAAVGGGLGVPAQYLSKATAVAFLKQTFAQQLLSTVAIGLIKISICLYQKRIFSANKFFLVWINIMILLSVGWTLVFFLALTFSYWPVSDHWSLNSEVHQNLNFSALIISMATTSVALDLWIICMPIPVIRQLNLTSRQKWRVVSIFGLGAFCVVSSIVRLAYIASSIKVKGHTTADAFTYIVSQVAIWSNIEPCASVVCACLPTYGPFLRKSSQDEESSGPSLSDKFRTKCRRWVRPMSDPLSRIRKNPSARLTTQASSIDGRTDDTQISGTGVITVCHTFTVVRQNSTDLDGGLPAKEYSMI